MVFPKGDRGDKQATYRVRRNPRHPAPEPRAFRRGRKRAGPAARRDARRTSAELPAARQLPGRHRGQLGIRRRVGTPDRGVLGRRQGPAARLRAGVRAPELGQAGRQDPRAQGQGGPGQDHHLRRGRYRGQGRIGDPGTDPLPPQQQGDPDDRLLQQRGDRRARQAGAAREGALHGRSGRLGRRDRQGLPALQLPLAAEHDDGLARAGAGDGRAPGQEQEGGLPGARLHLRPHAVRIDGAADRADGLEDSVQAGLPDRHRRLQHLPAQHRQQRRRRVRELHGRQRLLGVHQAGQELRCHEERRAGGADAAALPCAAAGPRGDAEHAGRDGLLVVAGREQRAREAVRRRLPGQAQLQALLAGAHRLLADADLGGGGGARQDLLPARGHQGP